MAGGCHLERDLSRVIQAAGLSVMLDETRYLAPGPLRAWGWFVSGTARPA